MKSKQTKVGEVTRGAHSVTIRQRYSDLRTTEGKPFATIHRDQHRAVKVDQAVASDIRQTLRNQPDANVFDILTQRGLIAGPGEKVPEKTAERPTRDPENMTQKQFEHWRSKGGGKASHAGPVGGTLPSGRKIKW